MSQDEKKRNDAIRIFEALSGVDEELLAKSEERPQEGKIVAWRWSKIRSAGALAAAVCVAVVGVAVWQLNGPVFMTKDAATDENATPASAYETPAEGAMTLEAASTFEEAVMDEAAMDEAATEENGAGMEMPKTEEAGTLMQSAQIDSATEMDAGINITESEATEIPILGEYVPTVLPDGYVWESARVYKDEISGGITGLSLCWVNGMDSIFFSVSMADVQNVELADITKPETYNEHLYEIPYAETVPEEYREIFHNPIFAIEDFSLDVVETRMKSVADMGDTDTPRGQFAVLYGEGVLVRFSGDGTAQEIWEMFQSIQK